MSRQSTLESYFKKTSSSPPTVKKKSDINRKRPSLSLKKTPQPSKCPRIDKEINHLEEDEDVVILSHKEDEFIIISDGEEYTFGELWSNPEPAQESCNNVAQELDTSHETIIYNLSPSIVAQDTPVSSPSTSHRQPSGDECVTPIKQTYSSTPVKSNLAQDVFSNSRDTSPIRNHSSPTIKSSPSSKFKTPQSQKSGGKFYSPTKKRLVAKRSPAKKNLAKLFNENCEPSQPVSDDFLKACERQDDKTIFLLSIIDKYLRTDSLSYLLEEEAHDLLSKCMLVVKPGMKLVCRLYWCQRGWYRSDKLMQMCAEDKVVLDTPRMCEMLNSLLESGLIVQSASQGENCMDFDDYTKILKMPELQQICKDLKLKIQNKQDAIQALRAFCRSTSISKFFSGAKSDNSKRVLEVMEKKAGRCYKLSDLALRTLHRLYVLMYLGIDYTLIREKKLEFMLINDKAGRETYPIDKNMVIDNASVVFQNREEFSRYMDAHAVYESYVAESDSGKIREIVQNAFILYNNTGEQEMLRYKSYPRWLHKFTPPSIYITILDSGVLELKKEKAEDSYGLALEILKLLIGQNTYRQHKKAEWYSEMALILHKYMSQPEEAARTLLEGFQCSMSDSIKDAMRPRARLLANQRNIVLSDELRDALRTHANKQHILENSLPADHVTKQPLDNHNQRGKQKFETRTEEGRSTMSAEDYCIIHYINEGLFTHGEHWEGRIVTTMFFLLFWDIIYAKPVGVSGIFLSHYQKYPLDLFCESFYTNRKALIDDRLAFIEACTDEKVVDFMQEKWDSRPESETSEVRRDIGWNTIKMVSVCLGPRALAAVCRRLATDYRYSHTGFPDLTLWNVHTRKIKFVEVKTDADKPSIKQIQWMRYLHENSVSVGFCYIGAHTTRNRARTAGGPTSDGAPYETSSYNS